MRKLTLITIAFLTVTQVFGTLGFVSALELVISENGAGSNNVVVTDIVSTTSIDQTNEADITNDVVVDLNTGLNDANANVGDVAIDTGDISEAVVIDNTANLSIVNTGCCNGSNDSSIVIDGNGANSDNSVVVDVENTLVVVNKINHIGNNARVTSNNR